MRRAMFALLAVMAVTSSTGCCWLDRLFCRPWGCHDCCDFGGGCDMGCDSCGGPGFAGGGFDGGHHMAGAGGCSSCNVASGSRGHHPGLAARPRPAHGGHPLAHNHRNAGGEYEFAAGPPTGQVTYPYYTNRGPRDFLARNPRSIGP